MWWNRFSTCVAMSSGTSVEFGKRGVITLEAIIGPIRLADGIGLACWNDSMSIERRSALMIPLAAREPRLVLRTTVVGDREGPVGRLAGRHLFEPPLLGELLLGRFDRDLVDERRRDAHDTFVVAHDHVTRQHGDTGAGDRHLLIDRHVVASVGRTVRGPVVHGDVHRRQSGRIARCPVGDDPEAPSIVARIA